MTARCFPELRHASNDTLGLNPLLAGFFAFPVALRSTAVPEQLWAEFQNHSLSVLRQLPPDDERLKEIPPQFYAAFPLDNASKTRGTAGSFGYPSETYKVWISPEPTGPCRGP